MSAAPLTVKLRCASWRQLRTIYERDLQREAFFLKSKKPPPIGTPMRIQLTLPSESMVILRGEIQSHVPDGGMDGRGPGIDIKLSSIPQSAMWLIETALKAEKASVDPASARRAIAAKARPATETPAAPGPPAIPPPRAATEPPSLDDGDKESSAEEQLLEALAHEYESLQKLNPFQILGVGYEVGDDEVRAAFGGLTKKYHPDRFRRFDSDHVREYASEIFILIRNAYQQLGKAESRKNVREGLKTGSVKRSIKPPTLPHARERKELEQARTQLPSDSVLAALEQATVEPGAPNAKPVSRSTAKPPPVPPKPPPVPPKPPPVPPKLARAGSQPSPTGNAAASSRAGAPSVPTRRIPNPLDGEQPLKAETKRDPMAKERAALSASSQQPSDAQVLDDSLLDNETAASGSERAADPADSGPEGRFSDCERRINAGDYLGARNLYRVMLRKDPDDAAAKAGVELSEGLKALAEGDRLEAAQRFEVVLDLDPSNERAARELAEMRRHATNQRKGLLTRLLGQRDKK